MFKQEKGITLIALIITIIVLLILAGVSIAMLTGDNGILTRAKGSKSASFQGEFKEAVALTIADITTKRQADLVTDPAAVPTDPTKDDVTASIQSINAGLGATCTNITFGTNGKITSATFKANYEGKDATATYNGSTVTVNMPS